jgi:class 3 adenylate cyclase
MFDQEAARPPPVGGPKPGTISALVEELVRRPEEEHGAAWGEPLAPGTVIGRFELVRELGRGGFGVVYEARDRELGRLVAFKAVRPGKHQALREERLLREAEAAARLCHPNIVTLFDLGRSDRGPYLVMELLRGWPLRRRMEQGPLPVLEALRIGIEMSKGLAHAHAQGVIHRDLKPANVFLCEDGQVKVLDLGLAHAFGHRKLDGGTPGYMAPEQRRAAPEDERTDVFAMGVILFEMMVGEIPFREDGTPSRSAPNLDVREEPALGTLVHRMLATDPVSRPRDAAEVLQALTVIGRELERPTPAGLPRPVVHAAPRRRGEHDTPDRTWLGSVVYVDMVDYAEQPAELQSEWKAALDGDIATAIQAVPESERIVVDAGCGTAVCFLGDPGAAVSCALGLLRVPRARGTCNLRLRAGIHLGPVKLVRELNGKLNAIGDGVNVAQLVATCGADGRVLASRSFFEVASRLSERYRALFAPGEIRRDEHAHEHAVHELRPPPSGQADGSGGASGGRPAPLDPAVAARIESRAAAILGPIAHHLARTATPRASTPLELGRALAAFITSSEDREAFLRSCEGEVSSSPVPTPAPASGPETPVSPFDPALLDRAVRALAHHIGPLARVLVSRAARRARSEAELRDLLAAELPSPADRESFLRTLQRGSDS